MHFTVPVNVFQRY